MSNSKISALTGATTPLAGTEVLPIVQSSATVNVTVANLTAGREINALSFKTSSGQVVPTSGTTTTIFTCSFLTNGCYIVTCNIPGQAPPTYSAVGLVRVGGTTLSFTSLALATLLTISVSGQNIQVVQNSGGTNAVDWTVTRVS